MTIKPGWIAALPMYDFPELRGVHDRWWSFLREQLVAAGVPDVPAELTRDLHHEAVWSHPRLLLAQACEYPLARQATPVRLVASPVYRAPGCSGATYRSVLVVRRDDPARSLTDLRGRRCVINEWASNSGMNLLRAAVAPLANGRPFFPGVALSGSHRCSMQQVAEGAADVSAIDCVTFAQVTRLDPALRRSLRILDWTPSAPSLPLITAAANDDGMVRRIRRALRAALRDPATAELRSHMLLEDFDLAPAEGFGAVLRLEASASRLGYAALH